MLRFGIDAHRQAVAVDLEGVVGLGRRGVIGHEALHGIRLRHELLLALLVQETSVRLWISVTPGPGNARVILLI